MKIKLIYYIFAFLIVSSMQMTDLKINEIKFGDFFSLLLILYSLINIKSIIVTKFYQRILICFSFFLISSFIVLLWLNFYPPNSNLGTLKQIGIVSISRFIQLTGCLCFSLFIHNILVKHSINFNNTFLRIIDKFMFLFFIIFLLAFLVSLAGINAPFVDMNQGNRLCGGFIEGGPFGLFVAFYFLFRSSLFKFSIIWTILSISLILASQSKAAFLFMSAMFIIYLLIYNKLKIKFVIRYGFFILLTFLILNNHFDLLGRLSLYWDSHENAEEILSARPNDTNLIMGRIAASYIVPEIIKDNLMLGIGLGNYSLVRNDPKYRGIFPSVTEWDLTGLGGVVNLLVEVGIIGLLLFIFPFFQMWRKSKLNIIKYFIILFIAAQAFGVQTYFQYIWFLIGIMTAILSKNNVSINNRFK